MEKNNNINKFFMEAKKRYWSKMSQRTFEKIKSIGMITYISAKDRCCVKEKIDDMFSIQIHS